MLVRTEIVFKELLTSMGRFRKKVSACWEIWPGCGTTNPRFLTSRLCSGIVFAYVLAVCRGLPPCLHLDWFAGNQTKDMTKDKQTTAFRG